jgi:hypothetical protein
MLKDNRPDLAKKAGVLDPRSVKPFLMSKLPVHCWLDIDELKEGESLFDNLSTHMGKCKYKLYAKQIRPASRFIAIYANGMHLLTSFLK